MRLGISSAMLACSSSNLGVNGGEIFVQRIAPAQEDPLDTFAQVGDRSQIARPQSSIVVSEL